MTDGGASSDALPDVSPSTPPSGRRDPSERAPCSPTSSSPIAARSPAASSGRPGAWACGRLRSTRPADKGALFTRLADEVHEIGEGGNGYLDGAAIVALAKRVGAAVPAPGLRVPVGKRRLRRSLRPGGDRLRRAAAGGDAGDGAQELRQGADEPCGRARRARLSRRQPEPEVPAREGLRDRLSGPHQGDRRGRRARHAAGRRAYGVRGGAREREPRGRGGVRRRPGADREICRLAPPYRDAGVRRRPRKLRASVRARLLASAPPPEGGRGMPGSGPAAGDARRHGGCRDRGCAGGGLRRGGDGRVHRRRLARPRSERLLFPRDEHPPAGRASGHRGGDRARSRRVAVPRRRGRAPAARAGRNRLPRRGDRGARLCRGSRSTASCLRPAESTR